jgi:hypothetical protein
MKQVGVSFLKILIHDLNNLFEFSDLIMASQKVINIELD